MKKDYYKTHYKNYIGDLNTYYGKEVKRYRRHFDKYLADRSRNVHCLDIGCGVGNFVEYLNCERIQNITGVDSSQESISICKKRFPKHSFHNEPIRDYLIHSNNKYDVISMFSLLEHIEKKKIVEVLSLIKSNLNNKGVFIFSTPNMETLFGNTAARYNDFTHSIGFTESSLKHVLFEAGFDDVEIFGSKIDSSNIVYNFIRKIYQPFIYKLIKIFFLSMDINFPKHNGYVLYGVAR